MVCMGGGCDIEKCFRNHRVVRCAPESRLADITLYDTVSDEVMGGTGRRSDH